MVQSGRYASDLNAYLYSTVSPPRVNKHFIHFYRDICIEGIEPSRIHNQWKLVHLYIESVQEIVECSTTLTLSEYKLFSKYTTLCTVYNSKLSQSICIKYAIFEQNLTNSGIFEVVKFVHQVLAFRTYRSETLNSNTVNSKFHLIRSFFEILARILSFHV